jgi:hypothetical protein
MATTSVPMKTYALLDRDGPSRECIETPGHKNKAPQTPIRIPRRLSEPVPFRDRFQEKARLLHCTRKQLIRIGRGERIVRFITPRFVWEHDATNARLIESAPLMPRSRKINRGKVLASLNKTCPKCGHLDSECASASLNAVRMSLAATTDRDCTA